MEAEQLEAQAARLNDAIVEAIDRINADEELSSGLVCAVLARIIARVAFWTVRMEHGVEDV